MEHGLAILHAAVHPRALALRARLAGHGKQQRDLLLGHEVSQADPRDAVGLIHRQRIEHDHRGARADAHLEHHVARHHFEHLAQLAGQQVGNLLRLLDEVEVPAALGGDDVRSSSSKSAPSPNVDVDASARSRAAASSARRDRRSGSRGRRCSSTRDTRSGATTPPNERAG
jgi:hypothetical protein